MTGGPGPARQPHADLDPASRRLKAMKIDRLLAVEPSTDTIRLLEVGTGSGGIAHYFAHHHRISCQVWAVDVVDQRVATDGFEFRIVDGTDLPFDDSIFDVVITNHVLEHVGERPAQLSHLSEIRRVLRPSGVAYLATPNRWALVEPHYRLPILSWMPKQWRDRYLRALGRGSHYDCTPVSRRHLDSMLTRAGLVIEHIEAKALRATLELEGSARRRWLAPMAPTRLPRAFLALMPTFVCLLRKGPEPLSS